MPRQITMENQSRPNLFSYATSELYQDAFICWLAAWAAQKWQNKNPGLYQAARDFVVSMIRRVQPSYEPDYIKTVDIKRQADRLDILIKINEKSDNKLAILVEDKTHTSNHSDQLNRYYKQVKDSGYSEGQMIPLYFKTGYQSKFDTLGLFKPYLRHDFLEILRAGRELVKNAIYEDFLQHLEDMDFIIQQFSARRFEDWQNTDWIGFFMVLYENRPKLYELVGEDGANWNYVPNPTGGFFGFWWYFKLLQNQLYSPYLQLENNSLCFKIEVPKEPKRSMAREEAYDKLVESANRLGIKSVERPKRMGSGQYMTVLRWNDDYRERKDDLLDFDSTLENLKKAQHILDTAFPQ